MWFPESVPKMSKIVSAWCWLLATSASEFAVAQADRPLPAPCPSQYGLHLLPGVPTDPASLKHWGLLAVLPRREFDGHEHEYASFSCWTYDCIKRFHDLGIDLGFGPGAFAEVCSMFLLMTMLSLAIAGGIISSDKPWDGSATDTNVSQPYALLWGWARLGCCIGHRVV